MPIKVNSDYGTVNFPDGTDPKVMAKAMKDFEAQQIDKEFKEHKSDTERSFWRGVGKGVIGLAGMPGTVASGINTGLDWLSDASGLTDWETEHGLRKEGAPGHSPFLTGEQLQRGVEEVTGPWEEPKTTAGRITESIGEQVPTMFAGPGGPVLKTAGAITSGITSELGGEIGEAAGHEGIGRFVGGLAGGSAIGGVNSARVASQGRKALKTGEELHDLARKGYEKLEKADYAYTKPTGKPGGQPKVASATIPEMHKDMLANVLENHLWNKEHLNDMSAPQTYGIIQRHLRDRSNLTVGDIVRMHEHLGNVGNGGGALGSDMMAAQATRELLRNWLTKNVKGNRDFRKTLGNWAMHAKIGEIQKAQEVGYHRASVSGAGQNEINTIKQEIRRIFDSDKRVRGYPQAARDQMEKIIAGSLASNTARWIGKMTPSGPHSSVGYIVASQVLHAPVIAGVAGTTYAAKRVGDYLTHQQIERLVEILQESAPANHAIAKLNTAARERAGREFRGAAARGAVGSQPEMGTGPTQITVPRPDSPEGQALQQRVGQELEFAPQ